MKFIKYLIILVLFSVFVGASFAADSATMGSSATIVEALSISKTRDLDFGSLVPSTASGTIVVNAATGTPVYTNCSVIADNNPQNGVFPVEGQPNFTYTVSMSSSAVLSDGSGHSMTVSSINSSSENSLTLDESGDDVLKIGGTLIVGANQAAGLYTGNFSITVAYE